MAARLRSYKLQANAILVQSYRTFMSPFCVLNLTFSLVAILGNFLVIRALWKSSSIPANLKKLFLSLAISDRAVGFFAQLMFGVIIAVMLKLAATGDYNWGFLSLTIVTVCYFVLFLLACVSFFTVIAIAVDRLLAIYLHLRYQELVTSKHCCCLDVFMVNKWCGRDVIHLLPSRNNVVVVVTGFLGVLVTTVAYIYIYRVVRYHQFQIQSQCHLRNAQAREILRERKSIFNALLVYVVFLS